MSNKEYKWKMYATYQDGAELYFDGYSEEDCMCQIADAVEEHGDCTFYTGVTDENYIDGERIDDL